MDTVLIILGILGLGAVVIAAYVFTVSARSYVSESAHHENKRGLSPSNMPMRVERSDNDRRRVQNTPTFPMTVNGVLIEKDRRRVPERRFIA